MSRVVRPLAFCVFALAFSVCPARAQSIAQFTWPANGATGVDLSQMVTWSSAPNVQAYYLYVGTTPGGKDIVNSGDTLRLDWPVCDAVAGQLLYARIWTKINNVWQYGSDITFTPTVTPPCRAKLTQPAGEPAPPNAPPTVDLRGGFVWASVPNATAYYLYVGSTVGDKDLANSGEISSTKYLAIDLPVQGETLYVRLWTKAGFWRYLDYTFKASDAPSHARFIAPTNGATTVNLTQPLQWTAGSAGEAYYLKVGSSAGTSNYVNSGEIHQTQYWPCMAIPTGQQVYARISTKFGTLWKNDDIAFTPTTPAAECTAQLAFPTNGAMFVDLTAGFSWAPADHAAGYQLTVGSSPGAADILNTGSLPSTQTSFKAYDLPTERTLYARLFTRQETAWYAASDMWFTVASAPVRTAQLTNPMEGVGYAYNGQAYTWNPVPGAQAYYLYVGTSPGAKDLVNTGEIHTTSYVPPTLPTDVPLYATLWTKVEGVWRNVGVPFTNLPRGVCPATTTTTITAAPAGAALDLPVALLPCQTLQLDVTDVGNPNIHSWWLDLRGGHFETGETVSLFSYVPDCRSASCSFSFPTVAYDDAGRRAVRGTAGPVGSIASGRIYGPYSPGVPLTYTIRITKSPRPGYNVGGTSFETATNLAILPATIHSTLNDIDAGEFFTVTLAPNQTLVLDATLPDWGVAYVRIYDEHRKPRVQHDFDTRYAGTNHFVTQFTNTPPTGCAGSECVPHAATFYVNVNGQTHIDVAMTFSTTNAPARTETVEYYHTDAVGSVRLITDATGQTVPGSRRDYLPFGEEFSNRTPTKDERSFAGKERDKETTLDYFGVRYYGNDKGRFISVDPITNWDLTLSDPQRWNRYAYGRNNPFRFIDPDGEDVVDIIKGAVNAFGTNLMFGAGRLEPTNSDFALGQAIGDVASVAAGTYEAVLGATVAGGGGVLTVSGGPIGVPVTTAGVAATAHGVGVAASGTAHLMKKTTQNGGGVTSSGQATDQWGNKIGPSGEPQVNNVDHSSKKSAKEAAQHEGKGAPVHHPSPRKGKPHYHPSDRDNEKLPNSTHHNYPKK